MKKESSNNKINWSISSGKVVSGSRLVKTSRRLNSTMTDAKKEFDKMTQLAKEDASKLILNA